MSLRIIDANLNRAREGLRTAEEYARLVLNDAPSASLLKEARRHVQTCSQAFGDALLAARDIQGDVGARPEADDVRRDTEQSVAAAGIKRAQEALRVIEEFAQLHDKPAAAAAAKARYAAYAAEQQMFVSAPRRAILRASPVMVIFSGAQASGTWRDTLKRLLDAGARLFQLREKQLHAHALAEYACEVLPLAGPDALVIINDFADIARSTSAGGVHLGQSDAPMIDARAQLGPAGLIGVSTHNAAEAQAAQAAGADYIGLGAMFHTSTKNVESMAGPGTIPQVKVDIPVFCIGGISRQNAGELVRHGAKQIAVSSALQNADDPGAEYKALAAIMKEQA